MSYWSDGVPVGNDAGETGVLQLRQNGPRALAVLVEAFERRWIGSVETGQTRRQINANHDATHRAACD